MNTIKYYENIALSNFDLLKLLDGKANIIIYPNLIKYNSIDEVLGPYGACILLFEAMQNYGHWCCLFKHNNIISFFNPYGGYPDDSLEYIPLHFRKLSNQLYPYLSLLLLNCPYELEYNEYQFQQHKKDIKTCGRHCTVRLLLRNLSLEEYKNFLDDISKKTNLNYDQIVTLFTA